MTQNLGALKPAVALALACATSLAVAQSMAPATSTPSNAGGNALRPAMSSEDGTDAVMHVAKAIAVVRKMEGDPQINTLLREAKGVFIVPDYGRAALGLGGQGGAGVLLVHEGGRWTGPGFYNFGGGSIGLQAGVAAGQIAMILMDDKALNSFGTDNKFSLNADAGLTIVKYSARSDATADRGDIVMWRDTEGVLVNASISITDVNYDENETRAYYGKSISPSDIVGGRETSIKAASLLSVMPA